MQSPPGLVAVPVSSSIEVATRKLSEIQEPKPVGLTQCTPPHFCGWRPPSPTAADGRVTEYKPLLSQHLPWFLPPPHSLEHLLRGARQQDKKEIQAQKSCPFLLGRP